MKDFWISCGHHLLDRNASGGLVVTDEFLKAYFARPELMPPEDACAIERRLHRELIPSPRRPVGADEVAALPMPVRGGTGSPCLRSATCCCGIRRWKPPILRWSV